MYLISMSCCTISIYGKKITFWVCVCSYIHDVSLCVYLKGRSSDSGGGLMGGADPRGVIFEGGKDNSRSNVCECGVHTAAVVVVVVVVCEDAHLWS